MIGVAAMGAVLACADASRSAAPELRLGLEIVNQLSDSIGFAAWELGGSHLVSVKSVVPSADFRERRAAPGGSGHLPFAEISGYAPGATVRLFVWRLVDGVGDGHQFITLTDDELAAANWRVEVTEDAFDPLVLPEP